MAAMERLHAGTPTHAEVLLQLPGANEATLADMSDIVTELAHGHPRIRKFHAWSDADLAKGSIGQRLGGEFDELYFAHDSGGAVCRSLGLVFPAARRVCIGDAFGMIYPADFVDAYQPMSVKTRIRRAAEAIALRLGLHQGPEPLIPDVAALVLPVDPSGRGLRDVELAVCRRTDFLQAVHHCHGNARALRDYMAYLLSRFANRKRYLLLTETYAEAGHVRPDREIEMYAAIIRGLCQPGSVVVIKPHPLETPGKAESIAAALRGSHEVHAIEPRYNRYPIEIWVELVKQCTVVSAAYPVLSLKYAHGVDVVQPMNDQLIAQWFEPAFRKWTRDSLRLYMEPLARLDRWDGRTVLWSPAIN